MKVLSKNSVMEFVKKTAILWVMIILILILSGQSCSCIGNACGIADGGRNDGNSSGRGTYSR